MATELIHTGQHTPRRAYSTHTLHPGRNTNTPCQGDSTSASRSGYSTHTPRRGGPRAGLASAYAVVLLAAVLTPAGTASAQSNSQPVFSIDDYTMYLLPGADGSSTAESVGAVTAADPDTGDTLAYSLRASDPSNRMYMIGGDADALYTLDSTTSTAARVGTASQFGVSETQSAGMVWHNGKLYMAGGDTDSLYTIDALTGEAILVATNAQLTGGQASSSTLSGVASHGGDLYATTLTSTTGRLYRVDLDSSTSTQIGEDDFGTVDESRPHGIASHGSPAKLYMAGADTDKLYEVDTTTGAATAVGNTDDFGVGETDPRGLASHNDSLYMIGNSNDRLYTLDTATGAAARVGNADDFGVGESAATGIASGYARPADFAIDASTGRITYTGAAAVKGAEHTLYAQVSDGNSDDGNADTAVDDIAEVTVRVVSLAPSFSADSYSYTVTSGSDGSSTPVAVGAPSAADPDGHPLDYSLRASDPSDRMYMLGGIANALYTLDSTTGTAARVGTATRFGVSEYNPSGLAWHNGRLYMTGHYTDSLYRLDTVTGEATRVATRAQITGGGGYNPIRGVASHNGELYVTTINPGRLYRVDLGTLRGTQIGTDSFGAAGEAYPFDIASHGSPAKLYMIGRSKLYLYTIDTDTGEAARVGNASYFGVDEGNPLGLASHNGSLYMTAASGNRLYTLNTTTGAAARVGNATDFGVGETAGAGIASGYVRPADFAIDASTGQITYTGASAPPGVHTLYVRVSDGLDSDGVADTAADDTARVVVTVPNRAPSFVQDSYDFNILPGTDGSSTTAPVGSAAAADPDTDDTLAYSLRASDPSDRMYMLGGTADALYTLDSATSTATRVGTASQFGISETGPRGMAWHNGKLYMVGHSTDSLHTLDTVTGEATRVATRTQITGSGGPDRVLSGVASHNGDLYVTTTTTGGLYRVDLDSSTGTQIGPDGFGSVDENAIYAIASHGSPAKLYMIGAGTGSGKFYTVDTTTGIATRVGSAYNFGVNESVPLGLASHGGSLYMTGLFTVQLFTVDTSTGVATRVGDATAFGAGESGAGIASGYEKPPAFAIAPSTGAIAYSGGAAAAGAEYTLYAQVSDGRTPDDESGGSIDATAPVTVRVKNTAPAFARSSYDFALTPGSDGSVNAITIGTTAAADPDTGDTLAYSLRSSDPPNRMYMLGGTAAALYALDSTTSNAVRVGTVSQFGVGEVIPRGMTWHDGELYMIGVGIDANTGDATGTGGLYTLDIATGEATPVATKAQIIGSSGPDTHLSGAASHNGELYVTTTFPGGLHRIDLDTSTSTRIGPDDFGEIDEPYPYGIASHGSPAKLYMIGGRTDKLYTLDTVTGAATGIGDATAFGTVSETQPAELASHGGNLYMTGRSNAWLYTIDTATGAATRVGSANFFGSGESLGFGIATGYTRPADFSIGAATGAIAYTGASAAPGTNVLYAQASDGKAADDTASTAVDDTARVTVTVPNRAPSFSAGSYAYTLAKNSSGSITPAAVGTPPATDPDGHALAYSLRSSDPAERMYMTGGAHDALYALDSTTGAAVRVGATAQFGVSETSPRSLAWHDGQLYMTGYTTNSLYTIDVVTGAASLVATESRIIGDSGGGPTERLSGVASHDGELYVTTMTGSTAGRLYRLDLYTLTGTQIGVDSFGPVGEAHPYAIASNGSPAKLYMIGADTDKLYAIDTGSNGTDSGGNGSNGSGGSAIGTATPVGSSTAFGVGETGPVGLASHGGSLYMIGGSGNQLYTLNTATGAAVPVGSADDFDIGESAAYGIATGYTRPADFTINGTTGAIAYTGASAAPGTSVLYAQASDGRSVTNRSNAAVDDTARVTVTVLNRAPTFSQDSFEFDISNADNTAPGGNGNVNVGTVTAAPGGNVGNAVPGGNGNVNVGTVNAAPVGTVTATDPENDTLAYSLRASDPPNRMYMTGGATSALYTLNSTTGIAARVGHASAFGAGESVPVAMAWHDGRLYMTGSTADALYTLDTATGEAALVATETQITGSGGPARTLSGVASHEGELYVTTTGTGRLYRIDLDTLTGTQIGIDDFTGDDPSFSEDSPRGIASHGSPAKLYMIGAGNDRLYTLDTATGAATAIGGAAGFDLTDASPRGLASHGNSLYMIENTGNRLYTLNTATGAATSVGDATDFGVGESSAYGIATGYTRPADFSIGAATGAIAYTGAVTPDTHILYAQVSDGADPDGDASTAADDTARVTVTFVNQAPAFSQASYKLNILPGTDGSGTAAPVGDATASDPENDTLTYSLRASDPADRMYLVGHTSNALFTLDPATGTAARVGEDTGFGIGVSAVQGMAWHNGRLLLIGSSAGSDDGIFTVDTGTGTVAPLRNMSATGSALDGSTLTGIASHNGSLYLTATGPGRLIKADLRAGTVAQVGSDDFGSAAEGTPAGLASHGSPASLYMVGADNDRLYTLDTTTGAAATVGTAVQFNAPGGGEGTPAGLASHGSPARLYMVGADNDRLYTLDTTTGAAATVGDRHRFRRLGEQPDRHRQRLRQTRRVHRRLLQRYHRLHRRCRGHRHRIHPVHAGHRQQKPR